MNIQSHPDTPWVVDDFIKYSLDYAQHQSSRSSVDTLSNTYSLLKDMVSNMAIGLGIRYHAMNQMYRLIDALLCVSATEEQKQITQRIQHDFRSIKVI